MILAGDIGGTKSLLAFFSPDTGPRQARDEQSLPSREYSGLAELLKDYLRSTKQKVEVACFGIPGPIVEGRSETPNIPWVVDAHQLQHVVGAEVLLVNDLEATAYGIATLTPDELETLSQGQPNLQSNAALIAPGTGLGEGILFWDGQRHRPSASEGGHCDFAPRNAREMEFLTYLLKELDRVSFDRVVSGSGLRRVYNFLRDTNYAPEPDWLRKEIAAGDDPAAVISRAALDNRAELCVKALDMWVSFLGAEAGNLALKALATAGVYIGGGIAPKILPKLRDGTFLTAFHDKGRLAAVVGHMPVQVILNSKTALYGAARFGLERAGEKAG